MQKHIWPVNNHYKCLRHQNMNINEIPWDIFGRRRQKPMTFSGSAHALTRRPRDTNVTDSLFKGTGLLSSPAFFLATLAQAICFSLIRGLKDVDFFQGFPSTINSLYVAHSCLQHAVCRAVKYSLLNCQRSWPLARPSQYGGTSLQSPPPRPPTNACSRWSPGSSPLLETFQRNSNTPLASRPGLRHV